MRKTFIAAVVGFALLPSLARAQEPAPVVNSFSLALQQVGTAARLLLEDMQRQIAAKDAQIADLEKRCGDACKPAKPAAPTPAQPEQPK